MNQDQINMIREGVFETAVRNMRAVGGRSAYRADVIDAIHLYGLSGVVADVVSAWCMAQMGYGGGL